MNTQQLVKRLEEVLEDSGPFRKGLEEALECQYRSFTVKLPQFVIEILEGYREARGEDGLRNILEESILNGCGAGDKERVATLLTVFVCKREEGRNGRG